MILLIFAIVIPFRYILNNLYGKPLQVIIIILKKVYMKSESKTYALPIAMMFALFFMIAFVTNFAGSMGVIVQNQFGGSNAMSQLGTLANFIAYACMGIPAGIILKRKGYKFTALVAVTVGFVGVGIQLLYGFSRCS